LQRSAVTFDPTTYTGFHTWLSLIGLATGMVVVAALLRAQSAPLWTALFLTAAVATDVTGYGFATTQILPSHVIGAVSLLAAAAAILARYKFHLAGAWRWAYAASAVALLYFLAFVAIAQAFLKVPTLQVLAPTGSEPAFAVTQLVVLVLFVALGVIATKAFHPVTA
jgi:hypothetical protein